MATINGLPIEKSYLGEISDVEAVIVLSTTCGKFYYSHEIYSIATEIELFGMEAAAAGVSLVSGELDAAAFYFERNVYGGASWSRADERGLMQFN